MWEQGTFRKTALSELYDSMFILDKIRYISTEFDIVISTVTENCKIWTGKQIEELKMSVDNSAGDTFSITYDFNHKNKLFIQPKV